MKELPRGPFGAVPSGSDGAIMLTRGGIALDDSHVKQENPSSKLSRNRYRAFVGRMSSIPSTLSPIMIRVLVADDHAIVRKGLGQIISETSDLEVADEAANGAEVISLVMDGHYDAVVLDINMPGMDGLDALKQLQSVKPDVPVLVLSMHAEDEYALRVLKAGASGYLNKESAPEELVAAIRKISSGGKYMSSEVAESLLSHLNAGGKGPLHANLSDREFQVLCLLSSGKTVSQIAEQLSLSVKTISTYRARLLDKMQMKNNAELTHYAIKNNLVF